MKSSLRWMRVAPSLGVAALVLTAVAARADAEDKITKLFKIAPGGKLVMDVDRGAIEVKGTDGESVEIEVTRKAVARNQAKADEMLRDHEVKFTEGDGKIEVRARFTREIARGWFGGGRNLQVRYQVAVPRRFNLDLQTAGGAVTVTDIAGEVRSRTAGGSLVFKSIEGPLTGHTSGGSINVTTCKGGVEIKTSGGGITLQEIEGNVSAVTSGGSISARKISGQCAVKTSGGGIQIEEVRGAVDASTSGGSITAAFAEAPKQDCRLETSGGGITILLPENAALDVDARTSGGRVISDLPVTMVVQGEQKRNALVGKINGGGPKLTAHTGGGSVHLKKK